MKFYKIVNTEIRKAELDDGSLYAVIGKVKELFENNLICVDNDEKWLGIELGTNIIKEFNSLEDAKNYYRTIK